MSASGPHEAASRRGPGVTETKTLLPRPCAWVCVIKIGDEARKAAESQLLCVRHRLVGRCCCAPPQPLPPGARRRRRRGRAPTLSRRMDMAPASVSSNPRSVEEIFKDFSGRRAGLVRALTSGNDRSPPRPASPQRSETRADLTNALPLVLLAVQMWTISAASATQVSE